MYFQKNPFSLHSSLHISLCLFRTWKHEGNFMSYIHNTFYKASTSLLCNFLEIVDMATFLLSTFLHLLSAKIIVEAITKKLFYIFLLKLVCMLGFIQRIFFSKVTFNSHFCKTYSDLKKLPFLHFHYEIWILHSNSFSMHFVHILMRVNNETPSKVTLNSQFKKTYSHLKLINFFYNTCTNIHCYFIFF